MTELLKGLLTEKNKRLLAYGVVVLAILIAGVLGVNYPLPAPPPVEVLEPLRIKDTQFRSVHVQHDLDVDGDADVDGTLNADAVDIDGAVDLASTLAVGGDITLENDEVISNAIDDEISLTIGGAEEYSMTAAGFFLNANSLVLDTDVDTSIAGSLDDYITITLGAAGGQVAIATGNLKIGDGAETLALGGEDFYVEGTLEADGAANLGSTLAVDGDITLENDEVLSNAVDGELSLTIGATEEYSITAIGFYLNGNNFYLDVDVDTYFDNAIDDEISIFIGGAEEYSMTATGFFLNDNGLYLDADVDTYIINDEDDEVSIYIGAAEEYSMTAAGFFLNGNGLYLDVDVDTYFSNAIDDEVSVFIGGAEEYSATAAGFFLNGNSLYMDADVDTYLTNSLDDYITMTLGTGAGQLAIATGCVKIGDAVESLTLDGEDMFIEGTFEVDGSARFDGGIALATGELVISNGLLLPDTDDLTINDGDWLTPTLLNVYSLDASGDVTFTLGTTTNDGQLLTLSADDNHRYCLNATNLRTTDGNEIVFGQYDVLVFIANDEEWLLVSNSGNQ